MGRLEGAGSPTLVTLIAFVVFFVCGARFVLRFVERRRHVSLALATMCVSSVLPMLLVDGLIGRELFPVIRWMVPILGVWLLWGLGKAEQYEAARRAR